ncbi:MAG: D-alanyl-D-alanine carboxypeptidase [Fimbriimonadales bacterium]
MRLALALLFCACVLCHGQKGGEIQAASYIAIDAASGAVLFEKAADVRRYPASTTKIMTALLLLESCDLDSYVTAPPDFAFVGESSMNLKPGERISVKDLLYCILLRSANDGCQLAALHVSGSEEAFCAKMTERARSLGAVNTNFVNPHGLHDDRHYSTARDLALIAREAMRSPFFRHVVATRKHRVERSINGEDLWMVNRNRLLGPGSIVDGIKTGYTAKAGHCFVGSAEQGGFRVITVVLDSPDWRSDTLALINRCYASYERTAVLPSRHISGRALVRGGTAPTVAALTEREAYALLPRSSPSKPEIKVKLDEVQAPVALGQKLGELRVVHEGHVVGAVPLVAAEEVGASVQASISGWSAWTLLFGVFAVAAWRLLRWNPGG